MKIKTISSKNKNEFDELVTTASETFNGKFTQTHVTWTPDGLVFTAVIFHE